MKLKLIDLIEVERRRIQPKMVDQRKQMIPMSVKLQAVKDQWLDKLYKRFNISEHLDYVRAKGLETLQFDVKYPQYPQQQQVVPKYFKTQQEYYQFINHGLFNQQYANEIYNQLVTIDGPIEFDSWALTGRGGGWYTLLLEQSLWGYADDFIYDIEEEGGNEQHLNNKFEEVYNQFKIIEKTVQSYMKKFEENFIAWLDEHSK